MLDTLPIFQGISIKDYAYSPNSNEFVGNYPVNYSYDGISIISDYSSDDDYIPEEINKKAIALFDFVPENDNEVPLKQGQFIWISYRHGNGWLVAEDPLNNQNGLVPEEYVHIYDDEVFDEISDEPKRVALFDDDWEEVDSSNDNLATITTGDDESKPKDTDTTPLSGVDITDTTPLSGVDITDTTPLSGVDITETTLLTDMDDITNTVSNISVNEKN